MDYNAELQNENLVICSPDMTRIYTKARFLSRTTISVLIHGESGVGKSRLAEFIRHDGPFVRVDCNAIPSDLFASELFGYTPNAFTGASAKGKVGLLEAANHGTVLFDEINELSMENQVLLLHFLQNKTITPIGALASKEIQARIIATSGRNLRRMVEEGSFRQDLYYRLCVAEIYIPPLRDRREDIPALLEHFIRQFSPDYGRRPDTVSLTPAQLEYLTGLDWVGNIREIQNFAQQLCFAGNTPEDVEDCIRQTVSSIRHKELSAPIQKKAQHPPLKEAMEKFERDYIQTVIDETPNLHAAAQELGISFSTLCRKKAAFGIRRSRRYQEEWLP